MRSPRKHPEIPGIFSQNPKFPRRFKEFTFQSIPGLHSFPNSQFLELPGPSRCVNHSQSFLSTSRTLELKTPKKSPLGSEKTPGKSGYFCLEYWYFWLHIPGGWNSSLWAGFHPKIYDFPSISKSLGNFPTIPMETVSEFSVPPTFSTEPKVKVHGNPRV